MEQGVFRFPLCAVPAPDHDPALAAELRELLAEACAGDVQGLALVVQRRDGSYSLSLRGICTEDDNRVWLAGALAQLQSMVLQAGASL